MREDYLHFLWNHKRLPFHKLKLTTGESIQIIESGWLNHDAGPDFFNGSFKLNGIIWTGNIEIHIKSSDWYRHQHHCDPAYDNVILHVVLHHDMDVTIHDRILPTIELIDHIQTDHLQQFQHLIQNKSPLSCAINIHEVAKSTIKQQIDLAFFQRIQRKSQEIKQFNHNTNNDTKSILFYAIIQAFGGSTNKMAFQELAKTIPYQLILRAQWDELKIEALLFGCAGFLDTPPANDYLMQLYQEWRFLKHKHQLQSVQLATWKFGGVRPTSFPTFRIAQLAQIIKNWQMSISISNQAEQLAQEIQQLLAISNEHPFWSYHYHFDKTTRFHGFSLSKATKALIIINGFIPYLAYLHLNKEKMDYLDLIEELLENINSEQNYITKIFQKHGVKLENAKESQGVIELYKHYCSLKNCLKCQIGMTILAKD